MEQLIYEFVAADAAAGQVLTGVVGSGDLEVMLEPGAPGTTRVSVNTSVNGKSKIWDAVLTRIFTSALLPAVNIEINDAGATPGVVRMRIEQAFEALSTPNRR
jgi:malonate decarboxylase delta subunit